MTALQQGATPAQAAGLTFGGVQPLAGAARTLTHIPGLRGTALGEAAEQFTEGAVTRRVARDLPVVGRMTGPLVGGMLLTDRDPDKAEYDKQGRVIWRPMLVPAVGEGLEGWTTPRGKRSGKHAMPETDWQEDENGELIPGFTPIKRTRMGMFTPVAPTPTAAAQDEELARERETYADNMRGEEMEQHITDTMRRSGASGGTGGGERVETAAARLERSAEALERAAAAMTMAGSLRMTGSTDVAGVMGDVIRLLGGTRASGVDHLTTAGLMARALGVAPLEDGNPPVRDNLARFGVYVDQTARLGMSPDQTERVGREVKESPERRIAPETRAELVEQVVKSGRSRDDAEREVNRLEIAARLLPNEITAHGTMPVPNITVSPEVKVEPQITVQTSGESDARDDAMRRSTSMSGSETMLRGDGG